MTRRCPRWAGTRPQQVALRLVADPFDGMYVSTPAPHGRDGGAAGRADRHPPGRRRGPARGVPGRMGGRPPAPEGGGPRPHVRAGAARAALGRRPRRRVTRGLRGPPAARHRAHRRRPPRGPGQSSSATAPPSGRSSPRPATPTPFAFINADNTSISRLVVTPERWIVRGLQRHRPPGGLSRTWRASSWSTVRSTSCGAPTSSRRAGCPPCATGCGTTASTSTARRRGLLLRRPLPPPPGHRRGPPAGAVPRRDRRGALRRAPAAMPWPRSGRRRTRPPSTAPWTW